MNKLFGIKFMQNYGFNTVVLMSYDEIMQKKYIIKNGLSLRLSSKNKNSMDVNLASIHNCVSKKSIKEFYEKHSKDFDVLIHETVRPTIIGSISKYFLGMRCIIAIETYENFEARSKGLIKERAIFDFIGEKYLKYNKCDNIDYIKLGNLVKDIQLNEFDIEFIKQDGIYVFTDFYSKEL